MKQHYKWNVYSNRKKKHFLYNRKATQLFLLREIQLCVLVVITVYLIAGVQNTNWSVVLCFLLSPFLNIGVITAFPIHLGWDYSVYVV